MNYAIKLLEERIAHHQKEINLAHDYKVHSSKIAALQSAIDILQGEVTAVGRLEITPAGYVELGGEYLGNVLKNYNGQKISISKVMDITEGIFCAMEDTIHDLQEENKKLALESYRANEGWE